MNPESVALATVISYVRGPHDAQVALLAERLIADGVPCDLDLFETRPAGGWSRWMTEKMTGTDVVLVVCSEPYYRRYHLEEKPGIGKGASFEGGMLSRRVLEAQGSEHGVIPIVFDRGDIRFIPEFLRDETYFVLPEQFDDLYRVLTRQPAFVKPPLGKVRIMPALNAVAPIERPESLAGTTTASKHSSPPLPLAVFRFEDRSFIFGRYAELARENGTIVVSLVVEDDADRANFPRLQRSSGSIDITWSLEMASVRGTSYRERHLDGRHVVEVGFAEQARSTARCGSEVNFNGISADQIALRRARRILLDGRPKEPSELGSFSTSQMNESILEMYVSGETGSSVAVKGSPIPTFFKGENSEREAIEAARLICVFSLLETHTVERITRLDMRRVAEGVAVEFAGVRERRASNVDPSVITVSGICPIA